MRDILEQWETSELVEFLNSYNRVFETHPSEAIPFQTLYVYAFDELFNRSPLLAMIY
jgi:hypothetical protein